MRVINVLTSEIRQLESKEMLTPQELRIVILKTMNHILSAYMFSPHIEQLNELVNELKTHYDALSDSQMTSSEKFNNIKEHVFTCMQSISSYLVKMN
jgi:hypothetical protein